MAVPGLKTVIEERNTWLVESGIGRTPRIPLVSVEPSIEPIERVISVCLRVRAQGKSSVKRVVAHIEIDHIFQEIEMRDDGSQGDQVKGDRVFTATLMLPRADAVLDYYFSVEAKGGEVNFLTYSGGFQPFTVGPERPTQRDSHRLSP